MVSVLFNPTLQLLRKPKGIRGRRESEEIQPKRSKRACRTVWIPLFFGVGGLVGVMAGMAGSGAHPGRVNLDAAPSAEGSLFVVALVHGFVVMVVPTLVTVALIFRFWMSPLGAVTRFKSTWG